MRSIRKYQRSTELLLGKTAFRRILYEVVLNFKSDARIQASALECLQEAAEAFLVLEFEMANLCAIHANRVTLQQKDMQLAAKLRRTYKGDDI